MIVADIPHQCRFAGACLTANPVCTLSTLEPSNEIIPRLDSSLGFIEKPFKCLRMCLLDSFFSGLDIRIPQTLKKSLVVCRFCQDLLMLFEAAIKVGT